jgi:hypothetical protein
LEIGDSTDSVSSHRSSYYAWRYKLRIEKGKNKKKGSASQRPLLSAKI